MYVIKIKGKFLLGTGLPTANKGFAMKFLTKDVAENYIANNVVGFFKPEFDRTGRISRQAVSIEEV